ncbi:MAG: hypothetical protein AB9844_12940 [Clostridiaceae bacterium]
MKKNLTELVFILDRSGSMCGLETDTIGGYNSLLKKQKGETGEALITTVLFDDRYEVLHYREDMRKVDLMTDHEYYVRGCTALLDATGRTISKIGNTLARIPENERPSKVLFVIITDGFENASTEYTYNHVKKMIERQKSKYSWEFIFLGANIDAIDTAAKFGINKDRASNYCADKQGIALNYEAMNIVVSKIRNNCEVDEKWKSNIEEDFERRSK